MNLTKSITVSNSFSEFDTTTKMSGGTATVSNGQLTINTSDTVNSTYAWFGMYSTPTSVIEITLEGKANNPNTAARVGIDGVTIDGVGGGNIDYIEIKEEVWKPYKILAPANLNSPFINLTFGFWSGAIGDVSFRNIKINVYEGDLHSNIKRYGSITNTGGWQIDDRFSNFGINSIEVMSAASPYLKINIVPFDSRKRPVTTATLEGFYALFNGYEIVTSNSTKTHVYVYIKKDGVIADPASLPDDIFINLTMIAD